MRVFFILQTWMRVPIEGGDLADARTNSLPGGLLQGLGWVRWATLTFSSTFQVTAATTQRGGRQDGFGNGVFLLFSHVLGQCIAILGSRCER